jgi:Sema domain
LQSNLTHLHRSQYVPGIGLGVAKCPFDPNDNSTAVWVEEGNPGDLPALYSGTNAEFTKADTVIFRTDLFNLTTGRRLYAFKRTLKYDSKWLDSQYTHDTPPFLIQLTIAPDFDFIIFRSFFSTFLCLYH